MNGISLMMSMSRTSFCPMMHNCGLSHKIDLIPIRFSNLHLQSISPPVAITTRVLKHRVYASASGKDATGSRSQVPEESGTMVLCVLLVNVGIIGLALLKAWEIVAGFLSTMGGIGGVLKNAPYSFFIGVATPLLARRIIGKILEFLPPFAIGDVIQVGVFGGRVRSVEGRVVEMNLNEIVLRGSHNRRIKIQSSLVSSLHIINKTQGRWYDIMTSNIRFDIGEVDKTRKISKEIRNMMVFHPYVLLDVEHPDCHVTGLVEFSLQCHLKHMNPDIYFIAKEEILQQAVQIIEKHGGKSVICFPLWSNSST